MKKTLLLIIMAALIAGCAKKQIVKQPLPVTPVDTSSETPPSTDETSVRYADWAPIPQIAVIYFDYDQSDILPSARTALSKNAEYLKTNTSYDILVGGHCDERGTFEYNLSLGQRRAAAVRDYYIQLGVPAGRIATISYGQEMPADPGHDEAAWAKNRRAETKVRTKK